MKKTVAALGNENVDDICLYGRSQGRAASASWSPG